MNQFEKGLLTYFTPEQLKKIQAYTIGIGGAGGLGSNIAIMLIRCGFKKLEIIDFDNVDASNLNRQHYFINDIGNTKVATLKRYIQNINPDAEVKTYQEKWEIVSAKNIFNKCDFIVEAFDNPSYKKSFAEYYQDKTKFIVCGNGMAGLDSKGEITTNRINNLFIVGDNITDTQEGHPPLAPRVCNCASKMAEIVLDLGLGILT